jgi:cbb3-type cytochrome oxidase cytochrome c subunit
MAATDKPYRPQKTLDIVFGVSSLLMLVSIVWMFAQDFYRPFKVVQREFRDVETAVAEQQMLDRVPTTEQFATIDKLTGDVEAAKKAVEDAKRENAKKVSELLARQAKADQEYADVKATHDSQASLYDILVEERDKASASERAAIEARVDAKRKELFDLKDKLEKAATTVESVTTELKVARLEQKKDEDALAALQDKLRKMTADFDRFAKVAAQKKWKLGDSIRDWPVIDGFAPSVKPAQIVLEDLTIDYSFKRVPRYDRCTTCHLGIDRAAFDRAMLAKIGDDPGDLTGRLKEARDRLIKRQKNGETLGFDPGDLPTSVRSVKLTEAQKTQFAAHPHLHLFVDGNSPHPLQQFGCTVCHAGQGSATEFVLAAHTPNNAPAEHEWEHAYGWERSHFWDFPMLPQRFVESSCLKCHHQVVDLAHAAALYDVQGGKMTPGPGAKVLKGYNLIRENGCFGCHEIAGMKSGRQVGPDLRLEPNPPLDDLTPAERSEILADTQNPPGTMRKVGPSLYRIVEKTNQNWTRKWIQAPRSFRPDTRMPHFYGLSNNSKDVLPEDQKDFPDAEVSAIAHYLFAESDSYLQGKDRYRITSLARIKELEEEQASAALDAQKKKELDGLKRRLELQPVPKRLANNWIVGSDGEPTTLPEESKDLVEGKQLFTIKGCLACHSHREAPVTGDASFGPNLSMIAAKIAPEKGDKDARRRWLTQWILNPNIHFPRTRMPVTQLSEHDAVAIAAWLLSPQSKEPESKDWPEGDLPEPTAQALEQLAKVYLLKAPGLTRQDVNDLLSPFEGARKGLSAERVRYMSYDADERMLEGPLDDNKLKWYVGKKSITRLGCFGCHNTPGFENAKPIGTPLNEWGKKDAERLAFEDIGAFVKDKYHVVDSMTDDKGIGAKAEEGKQPYEAIFAEAVTHHQREGFLHQKLTEPRSYDYNRLRTWDDRLRMPQFSFAGKVKPKEGESEEQAHARAEAEGREAVMTFILGLVAEPIPARYLNNPLPDRAAEIKGLKVLDKFNCAGCHQLRPGTYEFKVPEDGRVASAESVLGALNAAYENEDAKQRRAEDYAKEFQGHNAWTGVLSPYPDRLTVHGLPLTGVADPDTVALKLTNAVRFSIQRQDGQREVRDIPAAEALGLPAKDLTSQADVHGGTLANVLTPYLATNPPLPDAYKKTLADINGKAADARSYLPPTLLRLGEKVQPGWLFRFLRDPQRVRPQVVLRMPRFNMNDDEALTLAAYFAAVDRLKNPSIGLTTPHLTIKQRDAEFWHERNQEYLPKLGAAKTEQRGKDVQPLFGQFARDKVTEAERKVAVGKAEVDAAKEAEAKAPADMKKKAEEDRKKVEESLKVLEADLAALKAQVDKNEPQDALLRQWKDAALDDKARTEGYKNLSQSDWWPENRAYASDAFRMLANSVCLTCHQVPGVNGPSKYPSLGLASERLRPDWMLRWLANPQRMMVYPEGPHAMPINFPNGDKQPWWTEFGDNSSFQKATALRDILMNLQRVSESPANRYYRAAPSGEKK